MNICQSWLALLNNLRTKHYSIIIDLIPQLNSINENLGFA